MNQKSSIREVPQSVSQLLTADNRMHSLLSRITHLLFKQVAPPLHSHQQAAIGSAFELCLFEPESLFPRNRILCAENNGDETSPTSS
jgi:hypothetical protein